MLLHLLLFARKMGGGGRVLRRSAASLLPLVGDDGDDGEEKGGDLRVTAGVGTHCARVDGAVESRHHPLQTVVALVAEEGLGERARGEHGGNPGARCEGERKRSLEERVVGENAGVEGEEVALAANARAQTVDHGVLHDVLAGRHGASRDEDGRVDGGVRLRDNHAVLLLALDHADLLLHRGVVALDDGRLFLLDLLLGSLRFDQNRRGAGVEEGRRFAEGFPQVVERGAVRVLLHHLNEAAAVQELLVVVPEHFGEGFLGHCEEAGDGCGRFLGRGFFWFPSSFWSLLGFFRRRLLRFPSRFSSSSWGLCLCLCFFTGGLLLDCRLPSPF